MKANQVTNTVTLGSDWKSLYRVGGVAALVAGVFFRRNIAAEIGLFSKYPPPAAVDDWFTLLQNNRLLGLAYLNIFDVVNYALLSLMFLALCPALSRVNKNYMVIATTLALVGITVSLVSNTAFSMLSISDQYAASTTDVQKSVLLSAGETMLVINRFTSPDAHPGSGGYMSLLLIAVAVIIISIVMLQSNVFHRTAAYVGILAGIFDLAYCIALVFIPTVDTELLALIFIPAAGLFLMIWHIMVGWKLYKLGE